mmetsp:Transcript_22846/g.29859  ORF Transcript_22846/g.29859 Transcript_22846/m.29859 type:complete len:131 (+) Transcript_22846:56-448(+)
MQRNPSIISTHHQVLPNLKFKDIPKLKNKVWLVHKNLEGTLTWRKSASVPTNYMDLQRQFAVAFQEVEREVEVLRHTGKAVMPNESGTFFSSDIYVFREFMDEPEYYDPPDGVEFDWEDKEYKHVLKCAW